MRCPAAKKQSMGRLSSIALTGKGGVRTRSKHLGSDTAFPELRLPNNYDFKKTTYDLLFVIDVLVITTYRGAACGLYCF